MIQRANMRFLCTYVFLFLLLFVMQNLSSKGFLVFKVLEVGQHIGIKYPIFQIQLYVGWFGIFKFASFTVVIYLKIKILSMWRHNIH
jgi:hypothetical protein